MIFSFYKRDFNDLVDVMVNGNSNCFRIDNDGMILWNTSNPQDGIEYSNKRKLIVIGVDIL